jgi:hypothetical protein
LNGDDPVLAHRAARETNKAATPRPKDTYQHVEHTE